MAADATAMEEKLALLRAQYAIKIGERIDELDEAIVQSAETEGEARRGVLSNLRDMSHKLAGSGATFGFPEVSLHARTMEQECVAILEERITDDGQLTQRLQGLSSKLREASQTQQADTNVQSPRPAAPHLHDTSRMKVLVIMEYDDEQADQVVREMEHFGLEARIIDHPAKLIGDVKQNGPVNVIVTGLDFGGDPRAASKALEVFRETEAHRTIPVVVHTYLDDIESRLDAVRVGAKAYLVKPVDMADLVDVLDHITERHEDEPFRVLIVDDDESLARYTEHVLQGAGMDTEVVTSPLTLFEVLDDFSPELILLDLYMPECDGQELAAIVRQREEYAGIPIVFLSGESNKDKQLSAMELGGDDFLTKPIRASHLITSVRIRASRFRKLRSFMVRDSMTGLFNHTTSKQLLENEVARATRANGILSVAAMDIDHFKNVNDTYGHAVGDRVIKALARLLRQRLRSADIIGRMGGEEFAAILPDTGVQEAGRVFDEVRQAFSEIVFHTDGTTFSVTLSCGVAAFPDHGNATALSDAADKALYEAKNGGRNQVILAD